MPVKSGFWVKLTNEEMQMSEEILTAKSRYAIDKFPSVMVHETERLTKKARMAASFVEKWGMVAGEDDGEDSCGRAKIKLLSAEEVVKRACEITNLLFDEFNKRKWVQEIPSMEELQAKYKTKETEESY